MKTYDVIVIGGGFSGAAAAISAAREGASVLLVERANCLGGAAAGCLVFPYMDYHTKIDGKSVPLCRGIFSEINRRLAEYNAIDSAIDGCRFHDEYLKLVLADMAEEAGVSLLFHSLLTDCTQKDGRVESIEVAGKSGKMTLRAKTFIDASGDGDLCHLAGFPMRLGREPDSLCQPMTLCFRLSGIDVDAFYGELPKMQALYKEFRAEGKIKNPRENILVFHPFGDGILHFNTTRIVKRNPTDVFDLTAAELEARRQVLELFRFLKENFASCKNAHLLTTATEIGVRESRMACGEYVLTAEDLNACKKFPDAIAYGNYDIDIHNPEGSGTSHYYFRDGEYYTVPYRSLIPKDSKNLLVTGRCISATHEAQASVRIMPIVTCLGEAAGVAAALAVKEDRVLSDVPAQSIREILYERGALTHDLD